MRRCPPTSLSLKALPEILQTYAQVGKCAMLSKQAMELCNGKASGKSS